MVVCRFWQRPRWTVTAGTPLPLTLRERPVYCASILDCPAEKKPERNGKEFVKESGLRQNIGIASPVIPQKAPPQIGKDFFLPRPRKLERKKPKTPGKPRILGNGAGSRTRVHYGAPGGNAGWQQPTGLLHLDRFESVPPGYQKREPPVGVLFFGAGDRTRTGTLSPAVDFESRKVFGSQM